MSTTKNSSPETTAGNVVACQSEHGYISDKPRYLTPLKRIEGQARGDSSHDGSGDIVHRHPHPGQPLNKALESVALGLLDDHLKHCVTGAVAEGGPVPGAKLQEGSDAIARLVRS